MDRGSIPPSLYRDDDPPREELPESFVDRYTEWASKCTDAPKQYHRVHGLAVLSTVIAPYRAIETQYARIKPNLWTMILAGTTMTRKTTSMKLALSLLNDCIPDYLMGTDGTPEGIFVELAQREGKVSMFHRDEVSGWIDSVVKREYLSGILDSFMKFYDGQRERKVLRSATYEIKDPNFVIMSGGIKSKMEELISLEHVRMGFLPRFIIVIGHTTKEQMTPIGPPSDATEIGRKLREPIVEELYRIVNHVQPRKPDPSSINLANVIAIPKAQPIITEILDVSAAAWERIQQLERDAHLHAELQTNDDLYVPMYERMVTSIMKCAILLATARESKTVEYIDVVKAISYSDEWVQSMVQFCNAIELRPHLTVWERKADDVFRYVKQAYPENVTRSDVMRKFHLGKRQADEIEATLEDRQYIKVSTSMGGRGRPKKVYELNLAYAYGNTPVEGSYVR